MPDKFGLLSLGKASSHSTELPSFSFFLCAVFSCFCSSGCEACSFTTERCVGSLTRAHIWMRAVHTKEGQTPTSLHNNWLEGIETFAVTLPHQGSSDLNWDALTTELRPIGTSFSRPTRRTGQWVHHPEAKARWETVTLLPEPGFEPAVSRSRVQSLYHSATPLSFCGKQWQRTNDTSLKVDGCNVRSGF